MRKRRILKQTFRMTGYFLCAVFAALFIVSFIGVRVKVEGHSMENTLWDQDQLMIDKISYQFGLPKRFDIVVFLHMDGSEKQYYIKRIIGLPGEKVYIDRNGSIYINDELLEENYGKETIRDPRTAAVPMILGEEEYFVLGDNRNHSSDSRDPKVGTVKESEIVGKAFCRIYPFSKIGTLYEN